MSEWVEFIFNNSSVFNNEKRTLCLPCLFILNFPKFIAMLISKQLTHDGLRLVCCKAHQGRHVKPLSNSSVKFDAGCDQLRRRCKNGVLFGGRRDESKNKTKKKEKGENTLNRRGSNEVCSQWKQKILLLKAPIGFAPFVEISREN